MKTSVDRFVLTMFVGVAVLLLAAACAHQGDPFVPIVPGKPESTKVEEGETGRWVRKKSPYYVIKSVVVPRTKSLVIEPGVTVVFTKKGQNLTVDGRLLAVGKPESLITFRPTIPAGGAAHAGDWGGVILNGTGNGLGHELANVKIQYATTGLEVKDGVVSIDGLAAANNQADAVKITRSSMTLRNATIANNGQNGITLNSCEDPFNVVVIDSCNIGYNAYAGIWSSGSSALIERSDIKNNGGACLGAPDEVQAFCGGLHFDGAPGVKLPVLRMCNLEANIPCDVRNLMVLDLMVSADSTYWGLSTTDIMNKLSDPAHPTEPDKRNCAFNVKAICDGLDTGSGTPTVRFCWWRDEPWPNFPSSSPGVIHWSAPGARWR